MHRQDARIVIALPASTHAVFKERGERLWETLDELLRTDQLGHVAGYRYAACEGHYEVQVQVDRVYAVLDLSVPIPSS